VSTPQTPETPPDNGFWTIRRIVLGVIIVYVLVVVIANRRSTPVNFVFFKTEASLFVILLLALALGFVAGWLFDDLRERRRRKKDD